MQNQQISVLGCGWLGLPLAKRLISKKFIVKGSSTTQTKKPILIEADIKPYLFKLGDNKREQYQKFLSGSQIIIINFPPKRIPNIKSIYQEQIKDILPHITSSQKVIFISSTSVYQDTNDWVTESIETKPEKDSGKAILAVEELLKSKLKQNLTILRLSGLVGYDRIPGKFLANKKEVSNGKAPVNIIHQDDCIGLICAIIQKKCWGEIINGCADEHPSKEIFYTKAAKHANLTPPEFKISELSKFKKISNTKSKSILNYSYKYPNPLALFD